MSGRAPTAPSKHLRMLTFGPAAHGHEVCRADGEQPVLNAKVVSDVAHHDHVAQTAALNRSDARRCTDFLLEHLA